MLVQLAEGNEIAYAKLVHALYEKLFPFTASLIKSEAEVDDILQEVFLKIWLHRQSFATMENPTSWVFRVIANTASNHLRAQLRKERRIQKMNVQTVVLEDIEEKIDTKLRQSMVAEAVEQLPVKRKMVFLLSKKEGMSRKEIAEQLHVSENTVRNQLAEAIKFINNYLGKADPILPILLLLERLVHFF